MISPPGNPAGELRVAEIDAICELAFRFQSWSRLAFAIGVRRSTLLDAIYLSPRLSARHLRRIRNRVGSVAARRVFVSRTVQ